MSEINFTRSIRKFVFRHSLVFALLLVGLVGAATAQRLRDRLMVDAAGNRSRSAFRFVCLKRVRQCQSL